VLCTLEGFGEREEKMGNAVRLARTPILDALGARSPRVALSATGPSVGLGEGRVGSSALAHLALGAGRAPRTEAARIDELVADRKLGTNPIVARSIWIAQDRKCRLHLFGVISESGVHASFDHLRALLHVADMNDVKVVVHAILDGQAAHPKSAWKHLEILHHMLEGKGEVGTLSGRRFAMDRGGRWDLVNKAYTAIVRGQAETHATVFEALRIGYSRGQNDATFEPVRIGEYEGIKGDFMADFSAEQPFWEWIGEEVGFAFGHRPDRMRQLAAMLVRRGVPPEVEQQMLTDRGKPVRAFDAQCFLAMTEMGRELEVPPAFGPEPILGSLGEALEAAGLTQIRIAETEKAPHVTHLFSGWRAEPFAREERVLVPSSVAGDEQRAAEVAIAADRVIRSGQHDFVLVNLADCDLAGHTGDLDAAVAAVEAVDAAVGVIARAVEETGGALVVVGTHGNVERMLDDDGKPHTGHTTSPVPLWYASADDPATLAPGSLSDVAPTVLEILGIAPPAAMTGRSLRKPR
jgi:2,3-bisphosphoglycerate-independent phosphoglycerate mutase